LHPGIYRSVLILFLIFSAGSYYDTPAALNVIPDITGQSGISQSHVGTFGNSSVGWSCSNSYEPAYSPVTLSGGSSGKT
jgi:hypothetical protein